MTDSFEALMAESGSQQMETNQREEREHTKLCNSAAAWLRSAKGCGIAAAELTAMANEKPDVVG